jgi:ribosomal protein S18 acetylase RimI-like enzyme
MSEILSELKFDQAEPEELALVFDSWARSFQKSPWAGCIPNHLYAQVSRQASAEIIDRGALVLVAYVQLPNERRVVGYSVSEPEHGTLHWLFVKHDYRRLGVGRALLDETLKHWGVDERTYTYRTRASTPFLGGTWRHDPRRARVKV